MKLNVFFFKIATMMINEFYESWYGGTVYDAEVPLQSAEWGF